jgi:hypothetical protein
LVTDKQVRRLFVLVKTEGNQETAAAKAGMDAKTARKYRRLGQLPSELPAPPRWRTRPDPFIEVWGEICALLEINAGLEAKTVFEFLQRRSPGEFEDGQLRTLQRRVKNWRATEGPAKEVFFAQQHPPGRLGASDFTHMEELGVTIQGQRFPHLIYHFVLTYSNWEAGTCAIRKASRASAKDSKTPSGNWARFRTGIGPIGYRRRSATRAIQPSSRSATRD